MKLVQKLSPQLFQSFALFISIVNQYPCHGFENPSNKIHQSLFDKLTINPTDKVDIFISLDEGIQSTVLASFQSKDISNRGTKTTLLYNQLRNFTFESQKHILGYLEAKLGNQESYKSFWITNQILVRNANLELVLDLATKFAEEIGEIYENWSTHISNVYDPLLSSDTIPTTEDPLDWNLRQMNVHEVWEAGYNGTGVVVGIIDTGVRGTHEALKDNYRNDGKSWRDPYNQYTVPTDIYNHGTHVAGTVVGNKNGIGIAPYAKWIACKGYDDDGGGLMSSFLECGQFVVCPTDPNGNNPDCSRVVDVGTNSWGFNGGTLFEDMLSVWNTVGIVAVFANGNFGPGCGNLLSPADNQLAIGIGATSIDKRLAEFSSRGPSNFESILKPDVSAPGVNIYSADATGDEEYSIKSGTSMACPNAAGVSTLIKSAKPDIEYEEFRVLLQNSVSRDVISTGEICDAVSDSQWPNNHFGHGIINALRAMENL